MPVPETVRVPASSSVQVSCLPQVPEEIVFAEDCKDSLGSSVQSSSAARHRERIRFFI